ncbi:KH domain-containing protein [Candidatus Dojkabacteria bacterium]|uniref:KH domain-containing protein n=1 Tax=Candidatus Dojkabacteria bacterium TaxID=2099670 RepID=A0A955RKC5_9BACT|nr:KH domain-containing protein [Candidatus Dojkabacteria bacterium]
MTTDSLKNKAEQLMGEFLQELGIPAEVSVEIVELEEDDKEGSILKIHLQGDELGDLIGYQGKNLEALQVLFSMAFNQEDEEYTKVVVDVNSYRKKREEYLESVAERALMDVAQSGQSVALPPMKPSERRVIHVVLKKDETVETSSEGEEPERYVVVHPKK